MCFPLIIVIHLFVSPDLTLNNSIFIKNAQVPSTTFATTSGTIKHAESGIHVPYSCVYTVTVTSYFASLKHNDCLQELGQEPPVRPPLPLELQESHQSQDMSHVWPESPYEVEVFFIIQ